MPKPRLDRARAGVITATLSASVVAWLSVLPAAALDRADLVFVEGGTDRLKERLVAGSLLLAAERDQVTDPQDLLAAAQADYRRMVDLLYASGYYSGVVNISIDGREAAEIPPLDPPTSISVAEIRVTPGPRFTFGLAEIGPLAPGRRAPEEFQPGAVARATA
ncbi:MAG TPA: outer membrane protein assembly factor, partial [Paracoccaceae bacterium]|nr:outer membrane protein assembly factor [Paracoccaceae bacterium]